MGVILIVPPDRVADRLDGPPGAGGQFLGDVREARMLDRHEPPGPLQDLVALLVAHLGESGRAIDLCGAGLGKPQHGAFEERDPALAVREDEPPGRQTGLSPSLDGLGRDLLPLGQFGRIAGPLVIVAHPQFGAVADVEHQQEQVLSKRLARQFVLAAIGRPAAVPRNPK